MRMDGLTKAPGQGEPEQFDVAIVGAGISGIGCAYLLRQQCPHLRIVIIEALEAHGGTWRIHTYPGARSDSDLYTFGYRFKPWTGNPIASRQQILDYLDSVIEDADLASHIRYRQKVEAANWSSVSGQWRLDVLDGASGRRLQIDAKFLWMCQGYYRHSKGYTPDWPGTAQFKGEIVHPQHWPESIDLEGKRVTVIGSGATAATLIPALAERCAHVTMLQRTPTFFATGRNADVLADELRRLRVDEDWIHEIMRRKVVQDRADLIERARTQPEVLREQLIAGVRACLPADLDVDRHFSPPYAPLQQRVAFVPDGDLFRAISSGRASVVTDQIQEFDADGIALASGDRIDTDVVVTATGFDLVMMGDIPFAVDGVPVDFSDRLTYRGMLFEAVPNMAWVYGYGRYSWTLRAELVGHFVTRLLQHMEKRGARSVMPVPRPEDSDMERLPWVDLADSNAGYVQRNLHQLPRRGSKPEWEHSQDYVYEREAIPAVDLDDPVFHYNHETASRPDVIQGAF